MDISKRGSAIVRAIANIPEPEAAVDTHRECKGRYSQRVDIAAGRP